LDFYCEIPKSTIHIATKLLKLWSSKVTVVHNFLPSDCEVKLQYCKWLQV
jgi:hypothetical protein